jgi:hypothetical protein
MPGVLDCGTFMADWAVLLGYSDPIRDLRGTYDSERKFMRIIRREGGFVACADARLQRCGFTAVLCPRAGDLLAVLAPYAERRGEIQRRPTGAIAVDGSRRAVVTSDMGLVIAESKTLPTLAAWSMDVNHG